MAGWIDRYLSARRRSLAESMAEFVADIGRHQPRDRRRRPRDPWLDDVPEPVASGDNDADKERIAGLEAARAADKAVIAELCEAVALHERRGAELEAAAATAETFATERDLFAAVLQLPGLRKLLERTVDPEAHPNASEELRRELSGAAAVVNAAYDLIDKEGRDAAA